MNETQPSSQYQNSTIIAFDTSTESLSVCAYAKGQFASKQEIKPRQHGALVLEWIEACLQQVGAGINDVDLIVFGRGPGAFTGVRIACGVAQGLAIGINKPVVAVSSLMAMAYQQTHSEQQHNKQIKSKQQQVLAAIDARMEQVYCAAYQFDSATLKEIIPEQVCAPDAIRDLDKLQHAHALGTGALEYQDKLNKLSQISSIEGVAVFPSAQSMIEMLLAGHELPVIWAEDIEATYLRNDVAKKKAQQS